MLIDSNYNLDEVEANGLTALIIAASQNDSYKVCESLIKAGADVKAISYNSQSCLSEAVRTSNKRLAKLAIKYNAEIFYSDNTKY